MKKTIISCFSKYLTLLTVIFSTLIFLCFAVKQPVYASYQSISKIQSIGSIGNDASQYSPWIMHQPGWGSYLMYYCKNTSVNGVMRDRVWRRESWTGGETDWTSDQIAVEGTSGQNDDMSCSPGVVIDKNGLWHMYYVAASKIPDSGLYLYHATAPSPGINWTKQGIVAFSNFSQPFPGYIETPSPILINNQIVLYFVCEGGSLCKSVSPDGNSFSTPQKLSAPAFANSGRVTYNQGVYYYTYATNPVSNYDPPTDIWLSESFDGENFSEGKILAKAQGTDWDGGFMWGPQLFLTSETEFNLYYAANIGTYGWWGANTSLGLQKFKIVSDLTCGLPESMWDRLPATHTLTKNGSEAGVRLGFNNNFGGVGVKFELVNATTGQSIDIIEARSSAGAGWQFGTGLTDYNDKGGLINQAAGNGTGMQWGYSNDLRIVNGTTNELVSDRWAPNPSDTFYGKQTCPCSSCLSSPSEQFYKGKPHVILNSLSSKYGSLIQITNQYTMSATVNSSWKMFTESRGLYMSRAIARQNNLRMYLIGDTWIEGPIIPYDDFFINHAERVQPFPEWEAWMIKVPSMNGADGAKYALFVWNVGGKDIGILFKGLENGSTFRMAKTGYCSDISNDTCGGMDFSVNTKWPRTNFTFNIGDQIEGKSEYLVGTISQLEAIAGRTLVPRESDLNYDGNVNIFDLRHFLSNFLQTFTIFDYNKIVENFGK